MTKLYVNHNYLNRDIKLISNTPIIEFDIKDAGFTIIKSNKLLDDSIITKLENMEKLEKHITVGKILRDNKDISEFLMNEFIEIRKNFFKKNNIEEINVLSIKKDAIFLINKSIQHTQIGPYTFVQKNNYTSYFNLDNKEFYYDSLNDELHTKGLGKDIIKKHSNYFLHDIKTLMMNYEKLDGDNFKYVLSRYRNNYLKRRLNINHYREMNPNSNILRLIHRTAGLNIGLDSVSDNSMINDIDISHNYIKYIIPLIQITI